jgi:DNA-binding transcriptional ArsR family regulator
MAKQSFLLVSLQDDQAQKLAQVVQNASCRKILDYLTEKEATESELSQKLSIPLSTVHYNLKHLTKAELVIADEFHYSEKGKEVNHYKLANKYIIIAPKSTHGIKEKLKSILPVGILALGASFIIGVMNKVTPTTQTAIAEAAPVAFDSAAPEMAKALPQIIKPVVTQPSIWQNVGIWFLLGALFVLITYHIISIIRKK